MTKVADKQTTVLVIDPVLENIELLTEDLETDDYLVLSSTSGFEGISIAQEHQPDVVLLDLMTIDIDGFKVCRLLKNDQRTSDIPIILISSREDIDDIIIGLDLGAIDYISKPFHYPIAAARIRSAVRVKKSQDEILAINEELKTAKNSAQASEKSKALFLANMSHEIRTPLNGVLGMSNLLMGTALDDTQKNYVETISSSGTILMDLLNSILDYSKFESGNIQLESIEVDLSKLIDDIYAVVELNLQSKPLKLIKNIDTKLPQRLICDAMRLRQVFLNLITNAVKFTDSGTVETSVKVVTHQNAAYHLRIEITDTGIGIAQDTQEQLFKPFVQATDNTTRLFGGTGLGLAICKETMELMEGKIGVNSTIGKGSTFWFELKLNEPLNSNETPLDDSVDITPDNILRGKNVLLVEDNKPNQIYATALLNKMSATVDVADNGSIALEMFNKNNYDLILMDCQMPIMDGYEATRAMRKTISSNKDVIIIAMTANTLSQDKEHCLAVGMNDYLAKPFMMKDFYKIINLWCEKL